MEIFVNLHLELIRDVFGFVHNQVENTYIIEKDYEN